MLVILKNIWCIHYKLMGPTMELVGCLQLNVESRKQRHTIVLVSLYRKSRQNSNGVTPTEAPNACEIGLIQVQ